MRGAVRIYSCDGFVFGGRDFRAVWFDWVACKAFGLHAINAAYYSPRESVGSGCGVKVHGFGLRVAQVGADLEGVNDTGQSCSEHKGITLHANAVASSGAE